MIDQPFGAGHAIMLGFDPWFRAWTTQEERLVLDGVLYPTGSAIPAGSTSVNAKVEALHAAAPSAPIATTRLPRVKARPVLEAHSTGRDVRLRVRPAKARALRAAVKSADLPGRIRSRIRFVHGHASYDVVVRGARTGSLGRRSGWESALLAAIARHHVPLLPSAI